MGSPGIINQICIGSGKISFYSFCLTKAIEEKPKRRVGSKYTITVEKTMLVRLLTVKDKSGTSLRTSLQHISINGSMEKKTLKIELTQKA